MRLLRIDLNRKCFKPEVLSPEMPGKEPKVDQKLKSNESINGSDLIHDGQMKIIKDHEEKSNWRIMIQARDQRTPDYPVRII